MCVRCIHKYGVFFSPFLMHCRESERVGKYSRHNDPVKQARAPIVHLQKKKEHKTFPQFPLYRKGMPNRDTLSLLTALCRNSNYVCNKALRDSSRFPAINLTAVTALTYKAHTTFSPETPSLIRTNLHDFFFCCEVRFSL